MNRHKKRPPTEAATSAGSLVSEKLTNHQNNNILSQPDAICKSIVAPEDAHKLKCPRCGTVLERELGFDGADWDSVRGEGSGFDWQLALCCPKQGCGYVYGLGRLRNCCDICEETARLRPYNQVGAYDKAQRGERRL